MKAQNPGRVQRGIEAISQLIHSDFLDAQLRLGIFTPNLRRMSTAQVVSALLERFPGDPMVLPIPADAPPEIPRITLRDQSGAMELHIALSRSDLYINRRPGTDFIAEEVTEEGIEILERVLDVLEVRPGRLAAIGSYFFKCDEPAALLVEHFCKNQWAEGPFANLNAFEVHAHRRLTLLEGLTVNSWIRCKIGNVNEPNVSHAAAIIERDVNTLAEEAEERRFSPDDVNSFMRQAVGYLRAEIAQVFPAEG